MEQTGGLGGIRDRGGLESAIAQPRKGFGGADLYPTIEEKAAALGYSLIVNHPFNDGNKRIGHAAMEAFLELNGKRIEAPVDDAERLILTIAAGQSSREELVDWLRQHMVPSAQTSGDGVTP
jgi:death on curing protein